MKHLALVALAMLGLGCKKGYDQSQMAKLTAPEQAIVGKYEMKTEFTTGQSGGAGAADMHDLLEVLTMLEGGNTTLECLPGKSFVMMVGETPVAGSWNLEQSNVRLMIEKVGEMRPEQISDVELKNRGISGWNMSPEQRTEFLAAYRKSLALERAESVAKLRVAADGSLIADSGKTDSIFGGMVSYFVKKSEKG